MVNPINYALGGADPVASLFQGVKQGIGIRESEQNMDIAANQDARAEAQNLRQEQMQPLNMEAKQLSNQNVRQQMQIRAEQQQRQQAFRSAMQGLAELGEDATVEDFQRVNAEFPENAAVVNETWSGLSDARKGGVTRTLMQIGSLIKAGDVDGAAKMAEEYAVAAENSGDQASAVTARSMIEALKVSPDAAMASLGMMMTVIDPNLAGKLFSTGAKVQSSQMVGGRVSVQTMSDGSVRVVDTATGDQLTGQAAQEAIREAEQAEINVQGERSGARTAGKLEAETEGKESATAAGKLGEIRGTFIKETDTAIRNLDGTLRNIRRAISAIDKGGASGTLAKMLPNITEASAELKNAMDSLGLDLIGSVTFGALSDSELALAMDVAVPRNLSPVQLRSWLSERLDAQQKVRVALIEQAKFLADPKNTMQDWYEQVGADDEPAAPGTRTPEDDAFIDAMRVKGASGQQLTEDEMQRIESLLGVGQ